MIKNSYISVLKCRLCNKILHENFKTLPCLHNYCFQCLVTDFTEQLKRTSRYALPENFFGDDERNILHCPDCFMEVPAAKSRVKNEQTKATDSINQLESVTFVRNLLKTVKQLNQRWKCGRCPPENDSTPTAVVFCRDCENSYCSACLDKHQEFNAGHTLLDMTNSKENLMASVSDNIGFKESNTLRLKNASLSSFKSSWESFPEISITEVRDSSNPYISISEISKVKYLPYLDTKLNPIQTEDIVIKQFCKRKVNDETSDENQRLNHWSDNVLSASEKSIHNVNLSAASMSHEMQLKNVQNIKSDPGLRKYVIASKCPLHTISFIAYCIKCELCLCQFCWEQHSAKFKDCLKIIPLKTVALEKRMQGYALLAKSKNLIQILNKNCLQSLKKLQCCVEEYVDENKKVNLDIETIEALQYHQLRQNNLYLRQLFCFITFLRDTLYLMPDADLISCFGSITDCWQNFSSKFKKRATLSEAEPTKDNFTIYGMINTLSVEVNQDKLNYKEKGFQMTLTPAMGKEEPVCPKVADISPAYMALKEVDYISAIGISKHLHILLCLYFQSCIKEYDTKGQLLATLNTPGEPSDICAISDSAFLAVLPLKKKFVILQTSKPDGEGTFFVSKIIDVKRRYVSAFSVFFSIIACDIYRNVDMFNEEGMFIHSLLKQTDQTKPGAHRLRPGPTRNTFLLLDWLYQTISCYNIEGCLQFCIDTTTKEGNSNGTSDICLGKSGCVYVSDCHSIYSMDYENNPQLLWTFEEELTEEACIAFTPVTNHLVVSCFSGIDKILLILNVFHS